MENEFSETENQFVKTSNACAQASNVVVVPFARTQKIFANFSYYASQMLHFTFGYTALDHFVFHYFTLLIAICLVEMPGEFSEPYRSAAKNRLNLAKVSNDHNTCSSGLTDSQQHLSA